jgi:hypothetical protein
MLKLNYLSNYIDTNVLMIELAIKLNELLDINQLKVTSGLQTLKYLSIVLSFQSSRKLRPYNRNYVPSSIYIYSLLQLRSFGSNWFVTCTVYLQPGM